MAAAHEESLAALLTGLVIKMLLSLNCYSKEVGTYVGNDIEPSREPLGQVVWGPMQSFLKASLQRSQD